MAQSIEEVARVQAVHDRRLNAHSDDIRDLQLWKAEMKGSLKTLTYLVGIGLAGPGGILAWAAVTGRLTP